MQIHINNNIKYKSVNSKQNSLFPYTMYIIWILNDSINNRPPLFEQTQVIYYSLFKMLTYFPTHGK